MDMVDSLVEFFKTQPAGLIMAGVGVLVLLFILGRLGAWIIRRVLLGALYGVVVAAILWFLVFPLLGLPREWIAVIGIVAFLYGAVFGRIRPR